MDDKHMTVTDENGVEKEMEIILTFDNTDGTRHFVLFTDPQDEESGVYPYAYDESGNLDAVTDEEELEMCAEVLDAFQSSEEVEIDA